MDHNAIGLSIAIGLLSSFLWWFLTSITGGRKKIACMLTYTEFSVKAFEIALEYKDFQNVCIQCDKVLDLLNNIYLQIKPLTYLPHKKKLIMTYLFSISRFYYRFKEMEIGYSGEKEKYARLERLERYMYNFTLTESDQSPKRTDTSSISFSLGLLTNLIDLSHLRRHSAMASMQTILRTKK